MAAIGEFRPIECPPKDGGNPGRYLSVNAACCWLQLWDISARLFEAHGGVPHLAIHVPANPSLHLAFDVAAWAGGVAAAFAVRRAGLLRGSGVTALSTVYLVCLAVGAIIGAYAIGSLPAILRGEEAIGHSVAGALAGAIVAVELYKLARGEKRSTGHVFVAPLVVGIIIGRWGCFFAGLPDETFGIPSSLPWAIEYGDHVARHPVQIYESIAMATFLGAYLWGLVRRRRWAVENGFHAMVIWYALQRFAWEFLKPYPTIVGPLNPFHLVCLGLVFYGCVWIIRARRAGTVSA